MSTNTSLATPSLATATSPSDNEILSAVHAIYASKPDLGRAKLLTQLKEQHNWTLSDARLKKLLAKHDPKRVIESQKQLPPIQYPKYALAVQQRYKDDSIRCFKLYGRGEYDFGVTPNSEMGIKIEMAHERLVEMGRADRYDEASKFKIVRAWPMQCLWEFYCAAALKAGVLKEDVGAQLEAEYGVNPIPYLPPPPTIAEIEHRRAVFKRESMKLKREMLKIPEARQYIPVDERGEPIWDEEKNGEFCVIVVRINKGDGLTEYGPV